MELTSYLQNKGYRVYTDNYYTSPELFSELLENGFDACGTVRANRKGISPFFQEKKLSIGIMQACIYYVYEMIGETYSEIIKNNKITCLKWKDKRDVHMLSTFHSAEMVQVNRRNRKSDNGIEVVQKPAIIDDYNRHMGGVDRSDQMVLYYGFSHR
jgi:hypothetical protein